MKMIIKYINLLSLILLPVLLLVVDYLGGLIFLILVLLGTITLVTSGRKVFKFTGQEIIFFISLSMLVITASISAVFNEVEFTKLDRLVILMFAIPVYILYKNNLPNEGFFWVGLIAGAATAAVVAMLQIFGTASIARAGGATNPIMFGDIALVMGLMSLAGSSWFYSKSRWLLIVPILGFVLGIIASILSLSRGGWIAIPISSFLLIWLLTRHVSSRVFLSTFVLFLIGLSFIYYSPQFKVQQRFELTIQNLNNYFESDNVADPARRTSTGVRLEMWRTSWYIFRENPWLGVGWGAYRSNAQKHIDNNLVPNTVANFPHPHSQYFSALAKGGVLGVVAIFCVFGISFYIFYRAYFGVKSDETTRRFALSGLVFLVSFMVFSLTEAVFERSRIMTFFAFYLVVMVAYLNAQRENFLAGQVE